MSICFEFSKQGSLLKQYYQLREECFRKELGLDSFDGAEDITDRNADILIIRDGDECVGGIRISGVTAQAENPLPLEKDAFRLADELPELPLENSSYCQWERLVLKPAYRSTDMLRMVCHALIEGCARLGYHYAFNVTGIKRARLYKRIHSCLGYDYRIYDQIKMPVCRAFEHLEHLLSIAVIPKLDLTTTSPLLNNPVSVVGYSSNNQFRAAA